MPQRTSYTILSKIKATDVNFDDDYEVDLEGQTNILLFNVLGATADFLTTAPINTGINHGQVEMVITAIADATTSELVNPIAGAIDEAGNVAADDLTFDVDTDPYERFQDLITPFRVLVETEQMLVTAVVDGATEDAWTVIRGINGTTAATHADGIAILHLVGPETEEFRVDDASSFAVNDIIKIATGGAERMLVTARNETTDIIAVKRGVWNTTPVDIANNANIWMVIDDVKVLAAVTAGNTDVRLIGAADKDGNADVTDKRIPLLAADFA
jgi:hypothetical protein